MRDILHAHEQLSQVFYTNEMEPLSYTIDFIILYIHTTLYSSFELLEYQGETPVRLHIDCMTMTVNQANGHSF